jgi:hypothetical protein
MRLELKYQGRTGVEKWFGLLTTAGPENTPIPVKRVPKPPKDAISELGELGNWKFAVDGKTITYWQEPK